MRGQITLIGAGPGEPELLTVKAVRKLQEADAVFYDRLINQDLLNYCSDECELIDVGKKPKHHKVPQSEIENLIIEKAKEGKRVVRLKSGDPYVFGRGGEEGKRIIEEELIFEVIPGITSAIGGLAYAGIPITHRDFASSFHVITGHLKSEDNQLDWDVLAKTEGTLVFLMGMSELQTITSELMKHEKNKETPVAIVRWATRKDQKTVTGTLETICQIAEEEKMTSPSLIVMGDVVTQRDYLNFYESRPLFGKRIVLPHTCKKNMYHRLIDAGASVFELPKLIKKEMTNSFSLENKERLVFLDADSVSFFVGQLQEMNQDIRQLQHVDFVTIGHHTELAVKKLGILPIETYAVLSDYQLEKDNLEKTLFMGEKSYVSQLEQLNPTIDSYVPFEVTSPVIPENEFSEADYFFLPSSKAAHYFLKDLEKENKDMLKNKKIIVMGAITAKIFETQEIPVIQSENPSFESVLDKIIEEEM